MSKTGTIAKIHQTGQRHNVDTQVVEAQLQSVLNQPGLNRLFVLIDEIRAGKTIANDEVDSHIKLGLVAFKGIMEQLKEANNSSGVKHSDLLIKADRAIDQALIK